jgi:hypothetical protein
MEIYSNTTRFALACNQSTKVIEPIQSRCAIVRFTKLGDKEILSRVVYVCQQEKVGAVCLAAFPCHLLLHSKQQNIPPLLAARYILCTYTFSSQLEGVVSPLPAQLHCLQIWL